MADLVSGPLNIFWSFCLSCFLDFPANNIVKFLVGFTNKGTEDFIVESLDASFRYPQDYQFYIQNFTALPLNMVVPPQRQATFEYSFIPAEPMGGRPFGLVINLNYKDLNVRPSELWHLSLFWFKLEVDEDSWHLDILEFTHWRACFVVEAMIVGTRKAKINCTSLSSSL